MTKHISINPGFILFEETCIYSKIMSDFKYVKSSFMQEKIFVIWKILHLNKKVIILITSHSHFKLKLRNSMNN